jgi:hypothetical protein
MTPGRVPAPRVQIHPAFRSAIRDAMSRGLRVSVMAILNGFPDAATFSVQLHSDGFAGSAKNRSRWTRVAQSDGVRYDGEVFLPATDTQAVDEIPNAPTGTVA